MIKSREQGAQGWAGRGGWQLAAEQHPEAEMLREGRRAE